MIKTQAILEKVRGDRIYQLHLPTNAPIGEVHDVLYEMRTDVIKLMMDRAKQDVVEPEQIQEPEVS